MENTASNINVKMVLDAVASFVVDNRITYAEFDYLFNNEDIVCLSLKEQYKVADILYDNGIDLIDDDEAAEQNGQSPENELKDIVIEEEELKDSILNIFQDEEEYFKESKYQVSYKDLSNEKLCVLIQEGDDRAESYLCYKNRNLVAKYAKYYMDNGTHKLAFDDLFQTGMIGLLKSAQKFDINKGSTFTTYSVWWIKQTILRYVYDEGYTIRIPVHMMEEINKITRINNQLSIELGRIPTVQEIVDLYNIEYDCQFTEEQVKKIINYKKNYTRMASLDSPIGEDEDNVLGDMLISDSIKTPEEAFDFTELRDVINEILDDLEEREKKIIIMRFGLTDGVEKTLEEVGKELGVTRERIRQIEAKALRKLKHPIRSSKIKDFLD